MYIRLRKKTNFFKPNSVFDVKTKLLLRDRWTDDTLPLYINGHQYCFLFPKGHIPLLIQIIKIYLPSKYFKVYNRIAAVTDRQDRN